MYKWLKTGTLKRSASRSEIRTTDLAAMEITVDQQDDNHEVQRTTDWPVQTKFSSEAFARFIERNNQSVKVVNFIKGNSTNTRLFKSLCGDMDSLHTTLLLHTEVRWISRGNVLKRLFELRHEVLIFLR
ncbi:SCAN domain-containing protein 3 [Araneus ventricosus]|uniref:SCAN domain-containing protein 3 n=1 Tax=Araneus ventricosus TaxID=182803 RepID=A0A4Y2C567_ARAVE|nr:SCAN domain-containing protein 3 [Araneus ventricosus]